MSDFLQFLNTSDADSLINISGISPSLAESLIAARPFDSMDDCLKVRGMGKNLLARAQASFEKLETEMTDKKDIIPIEQMQDQEISSIESRQTADEPKQQPSKPSFSDRLGQAVLWFFKALLRLILIVLVIGGIGSAVYYGAPLLNKKFVAPVEQNSIRLNELERELASLQDQLAQINDQLTGLGDQLNETNSRVGEIQQSVDAHTESLVTLAEMQSTLESQLEAGNDKTMLALKHEIMMTRVIDMLARARLYLAQSNFGLAKEDVQSASDLLSELQAEIDDDVLSLASERLDIALSNLPDFPVVASGDLEIAWQILITGQPVATITPETAPIMTVTPEGPLETTPSITPTP